MKHRLVLFDIDGTLVSDGGASRDAFREALKLVYGYEGDLNAYDFSGRTDPQIAMMVLGDAGYGDHEIRGRFAPLWEIYIEGLRTRAIRERIRTLPGVVGLLERLAVTSGITLGLLTGNIEPGARLKLAPSGMNDFFAFGAFGSDSMIRDELAPFAVERASLLTGVRFKGLDVVIVGDSVFDVRCTRPHGARSIAVASGRTTSATLAAERPDHLFESLDATELVIEAIVAADRDAVMQ